MMKSNGQVGFSQRIRLEWLEHTAQLVLQDQCMDRIESSLHDLLKHRLSVGGNAERGSREKAITILKKVWVAPPNRIRFLRDEALQYLSEWDVGDHLVLHWCMAMAAYPFWGQVAEAVGRLLRLQGFVVAGQVQRRLREHLGERETVARATRRVLRSFVDWEVLSESDNRGAYISGRQQHVARSEGVLWVIKAVLTANGVSLGPLQTVTQGAELFPFVLEPVSVWDVEACENLSVVHRGVDGVLVQLTTGRLPGSRGSSRLWKRRQ